LPPENAILTKKASKVNLNFLLAKSMMNKTYVPKAKVGEVSNGSLTARVKRMLELKER
jgi:hypothetical protein